eukprot:m51a1_g555 putative 3 -cyclic-nucleotide phosphodiesterase rega (514) ;mRNA; f:459558-462113
MPVGDSRPGAPRALPRDRSSFATAWQQQRVTLRFVESEVEEAYRQAQLDSVLVPSRIGTGITVAACATMSATLALLRRSLCARALTLLVSFSLRWRRTWMMPLEWCVRTTVNIRCFSAACCVVGCATLVVSNSIYARPYNALGAPAVAVFLGCLSALHGIFHLPIVHHSLTQAVMLAAYAVFAFATGWWPPLSHAVPVWIVTLFVAGTFTWSTWTFEKEIRGAWAANNANKSLKCAIRDLKEELGLAHRGPQQVVDMDSPLEKVLCVARELRDQIVDPELRQKVAFIMATLTKHTDLFSADIAGQIKGGRVAIDDETATWLLAEVAARHFNDRSVLENHHLLTAFSAMIEDDTGNFLSRLSTKEKREARSLMIELVLATDMGSHLSIVSAFNTKLKTASFDMNSADDRVLLMKVLLKAADISNIAKPPEVYGKWSAMILEEFFAQGDRERELGLPVSSFMDRSAAQAAVTKSQAGFIDYIGRPLFSAVCEFIGGPATAIMDIINTNRVNCDKE